MDRRLLSVIFFLGIICLAVGSGTIVAAWLIVPEKITDEPRWIIMLAIFTPIAFCWAWSELRKGTVTPSSVDQSGEIIGDEEPEVVTSLVAQERLQGLAGMYGMNDLRPTSHDFPRADTLDST
ncbi:MAG: hypothetical protein M3Q81_03485 [bacterium]|nr:hypothetical protein [bacterium]